MSSLFKNLSKWTEGKGENADIVISTRVRLARNLDNYPFPHLLSKEKQEEVIKMVSKVLEQEEVEARIGKLEAVAINSLSPLERWVLVEKHLISPQLAQESKQSAVIVSQDESVSIMINEEDHLRIQCLLPALQLDAAYQSANFIDDVLEEKLDFAFSEEKGYYTVCPTNIGTGLRVSLMLHLPALVMTKQADKVLSALSQLGLAVRGIYGEGSGSSGNLFQISNQVTLGKSEEEILSNISSVIQQVIEQEKMARDYLLQEVPEQLQDQIGRAYGILSYAELISSKEAMEHLSMLRLGIDLQLIKNLDAKIFNELIVMIQAAFLQYQQGKELTPQMRDMARAKVIHDKVRQQLQQTN